MYDLIGSTMPNKDKQHFNFGHIHHFIAEADDINVFEDIMDVVLIA